jgi:hypothetical protein
MEGMRDLLRGTMGRSLRTMNSEDRLAVAWPVACGKAMAERGVLLDYAEGVLRMQVTDRIWLNQMISMRAQLAAELSRIAKVEVREIHFEVKRTDDR